MAEVAERLQAIGASLSRLGREDVQILAASKYAEPQQIRALLEAGHGLFGENQLRHASARWEALREEFPHVKLHMIGHVQRNKWKGALRLFDAIESVDSLDFARAIAARQQESGERKAFFVQINSGEEARKHGVLPEHADGFLEEIKKMDLRPDGLMGIPPKSEDPAPHFALLRDIAARHGLRNLSVGMSADYEIAAMLGATEIRVGRALFGEPMRPKG